jgi:biopolymer transport protein ExbB
MFELIQAGGMAMWPLLLFSVAALAIIGERFWSLQRRLVCPPNLVPQVEQWLARDELDDSRIALIRSSSPLGRVVAAGLEHRAQGREVVKEALENAGRHAVPDLERYLRTLGTIGTVAPFLGLLGTVLGMIEMFSGISDRGIGDPSIVANGISQALVATATGLVVAIPSVMFYRFFRGRVAERLLDMEQEALRLIEILQGERQPSAGP